MPYKPHRLLFRNFATSRKARDDRNASAMEGITLQADTTEKPRPVAAHVTVPIERALLTVCLQFFKHRLQGRMECRGVTCASFDRERDLVGIEVYVLQWQARFFDATALVNRDLERDLHPFRFFELFQLGTDQVDLLRIKFRLFTRLVRFQTQTRGSILVCPSAPHRLVEDRSQHFQIMQCSVARGRSNAIAGRLLTPFNKRYHVFAAHLFGPLDLSLLEECGDRMPRFVVFRKSKTRVRVTNSKPFRNPYHEILFVTPSRNGSRCPGLFQRPFCSDLSRTFRLASYANPEAKRFPLSIPPLIAPLDPQNGERLLLYREAILLDLECAPVCPGSQKNANFTRRLQSKSDMKRQKTSEATMSWFESMRGSHCKFF
jgi:hypothetical protein